MALGGVFEQFLIVPGCNTYILHTAKFLSADLLALADFELPFPP